LIGARRQLTFRSIYLQAASSLIPARHEKSGIDNSC